MLQEHIRNIAIIAHVDHGKTTLVDQMLKATHAFRENQQVQERVLDSNDQERERGITILAKNISIEYKDVKINVIDTPGHADFGGEVERVLKMADGAVLLVDAAEGPMPQTRFVLSHAIAANLRIMVCINKIDREGANPEKALNDCLDLMMDLGADDDQLEFAMEHVVYASAVNGYARLDPDDGNMDMYPLLDMIVDALPAPDVDVDGPLAMQCVTVDHSDYVGRIGIGRIYSGTIHAGDKILVVKNDGSRAMSQVKQLFTFDYLGRKECTQAEAGDIAAVVGLDSTDIGDVYTDPENPVELDPIEIDPPTLSIIFEPSTSPLVGREGDIVGGRQLKERLEQERENNVTMRIEETPDKTGVEVAGRGILHLSVLMEQMRREGFEFQVGRPKVLFKKDENGNKLEPIEEAVVECPNECSGKVIEVFGNAGGTMSNMSAGIQQTHLEFHIPTRGIMGLKTRIMNVTHGEAVFYHNFLEYGPFAGEIGGRQNGAMISMSTEKAVAYALGTLQERGQLFVAPGDDCYEGMLVGERSKPGDMVVNVARTKQLGNQRSSTADIAVQLTPPRTFTLEEALEYIMDDELVEVTPKSIRMRKRILSETERRKWRVRNGLVNK
ncbi:translational GTPase TypA [Parafannyhessea umbonata]|jgi:GTP-binding protein|uniref:Large ribosomal subunit assembly factor BipA n=2 Tax=Parafannyhessea umbonata TaxID=604330 RepID=A0A6N7X9F1_9ACTN|nr:translational GTPase TypA [Parafannyhessea umbonata]MCI7218101.1 translational GTPase TypA [Parafannyhessea umbonata]MDD6601566.1 translational GTPase TypA [Parafannyhessea umbonata]MDD7198430.1 translational GTPase TypA [Parafannyhessea umbonata]MDY4014077.1 translational GTPase TypA [Parafannyhessea umbonata]MDY4419327.1 translational GTPase TypA [Parafannyhessea umbonata]